MVPARPSTSVPVWWQGGLALGGTVRPTNPGLTKVLIFPLRVRTIQLTRTSQPVVPWNGVMRWEVQSQGPIRAPFYFSLFQSLRVTFCHHTCSWEMDSITLWQHMLRVSTWCNKRLRTIDCHFFVPNTIDIYPTSRWCLSWAQFNNNMLYLVKTLNCYLFLIYCFSHGTWNIILHWCSM